MTGGDIAAAASALFIVGVIVFCFVDYARTRQLIRERNRVPESEDQNYGERGDEDAQPDAARFAGPHDKQAEREDQQYSERRDSADHVHDQRPSNRGCCGVSDARPELEEQNDQEHGGDLREYGCSVGREGHAPIVGGA